MSLTKLFMCLRGCVFLRGQKMVSVCSSGREVRYIGGAWREPRVYLETKDTHKSARIQNIRGLKTESVSLASQLRQERSGTFGEIRAGGV